MTPEQLFRSYIAAYSNMDLDEVSSMLAEDVHLRDWKISVYGKEKAVTETRKNFEASNSIEIQILTTYQAKNAVAGELRIVVNQAEVLYVTDVLTFNEEGKISSIRAYLGREN